MSYLICFAAAYMSSPCHIELILSEKEEPVKKEVFFNPCGLGLSNMILIFQSSLTSNSYDPCFQDVRLIAINRPGRSSSIVQGLRPGQTVQESGRPINRRPIAINRTSRVFERPGRGNKNGLHLLRELGQASCKFWPKPIRVSLIDILLTPSASLSLLTHTVRQLPLLQSSLPVPSSSSLPSSCLPLFLAAAAAAGKQACRSRSTR